ncbi:hypothetical protein QAD02_015464 [Eretmocerus hayati]|uniref:Uncharacterized protein n=1 Tax=Eretmocerus hayati TaxID=131215 RepID=A0ACC2PB46_9HYME|nr:hypothetical protein QAD02_015464 [Eretmocerus hayati]
MSRFRKLYPQALAAIAGGILTTEVGIMCAWSSPYIAQLIGDNSPLPLTKEQASWVASLLYLGRFIGAVLGSILVSYMGSKKTTFLTAFPISIGWILIMMATSPTWLYFARVSLGIGFGCVYSCFTLFLGEVAMPEIRGCLVSFACIGAPLGNYLASLTGARMSLKTSSQTYLGICIVFMIIAFILPDSPHHLVKMGNLDSAKKSIEWYQGTDKVEKELEDVTNFVRSTTVSSFSERLAEFKLYHVRRATILVVMLYAFMQLSGLNSLLVYMETILQNSGSNIIEPSSAVSWVLLSGVFVSAGCVGLYDKCGRRLLFIVSSLGSGLALALLGTHFALKNSNIDWWGSQWLPLISLFLFNNAFVVGLGSIPSIVSSEVYATNVKPIAACVANLTASGTGFLATKAYQPLVDLVGESYVFYGHAVILMLAMPYALLYMPETKGKSLQQIQDDLIRK